MAETNPGSELRPRSARASRSGPNLSGGWVVMLLSGLIAAVLFFFATQQANNKIAVAVFSKDISTGQPVDASSFRSVEVSVGASQLQHLLRFDNVKNYNGWVANGPASSGDFVSLSALSQPGATSGRRSMSIPIDKSHAVNGSLHAGDRVDMIDPSTSDGYVAKDLEVLNVETSSGGIGGTEQYSVLVAVDDQQAVRVSKAILSGKADLIRSTGAPAGVQPGTSTANSGSTTGTTTPTTTPKT